MSSSTTSRPASDRCGSSKASRRSRTGSSRRSRTWTRRSLFAHADREHKAAVEASDKARAFDEELDALVASITTLGQEGDQKHEAYLDAKAKADEIHAKVVEMREKVLSERTTKRAEAREARDLIRAQNRAVRAALLDEKKLEASADEALQALLRKGRVEIGR